jgi:hypothetical protein
MDLMWSGARKTMGLRMEEARTADDVLRRHA